MKTTTAAAGYRSGSSRRVARRLVAATVAGFGTLVAVFFIDRIFISSCSALRSCQGSAHLHGATEAFMLR
jgi:hypothetical protein